MTIVAQTELNPIIAMFPALTVPDLMGKCPLEVVLGIRCPYFTGGQIALWRYSATSYVCSNRL